MRVPKDQGLFFTVFFSVSLAIVLAIWTALPPHKHHEEGEGEKPRARKQLKRDEAIAKAEATLIRAEEILAKVEAAQKEKNKKPGKAAADKAARPNKK